MEPKGEPGQKRILPCHLAPRPARGEGDPMDGFRGVHVFAVGAFACFLLDQ